MGNNKRPTVADIRAMKARGQKISMLYVTTIEEAADAAGIDMLSIEARFFTPEMRAAAGNHVRVIRLAHPIVGLSADSEISVAVAVTQNSQRALRQNL